MITQCRVFFSPFLSPNLYKASIFIEIFSSFVAHTHIHNYIHIDTPYMIGLGCRLVLYSVISGLCNARLYSKGIFILLSKNRCKCLPTGWCIKNFVTQHNELFGIYDYDERVRYAHLLVVKVAIIIVLLYYALIQKLENCVLKINF
jgi:hypothetical protein